MKHQQSNERMNFIIADARIIICKRLSPAMAIDIEKEIKESFPRASTRFSGHVVNGFWRNHSPSGVIVAYEIRLPSMPAAAILELARHAECLGLQLCCRVHCRIEWILPTKNHAYKAVQDWIFDGGDPKTPRDFDRFRMLKNYVEVRTLVAR